MKKLTCILILVYGFVCNAGRCFGQGKEAKIPIAVVNFIPAKGLPAEAAGIAASIQDILVGELSKRKKEFTILDRSVMQAIYSEQQTEQGEEFINSANLIKEGRLTGAKFIATGVVTAFESSKTSLTSVAKASASFSLKIVDLETGESKANELITEASGSPGLIPGNPVERLLARIKADLNNLMLKTFPPGNLKILQLVDADSANGVLQKVLLNRGEDVFSVTDEKGSWGQRVHKLPKLLVLLREIIVSGTENLANDVVIGELTLDKLQGQVSVWTVQAKDHGKQILDTFTSGAANKLVVQIE